MLIVSADKDLMQLVGPGVAMYDPASGDREERRIGPDEVVDYFGGGADKVIDIQALAGDSTDNVPGAPGIGVKTAAQLIAEYGDLETLLARAGEIKQPKRRETLTNPESVELIRAVEDSSSTLVRDVAVETPLDDLRSRQPDAKALVAFLKAMEFTTHHAARRRNLRRRRRRDRGRSAPSSAPAAGAAAMARRSSAAERRRRAPAVRPPPDSRQRAAPDAGAQTRRRSPTRASPRRARPRSTAPPTSTVSDARRAASAGSRDAFEAGVVAFDTETSSLDPMQAELVGFSLCRRAGRGLLRPDRPSRAGAGDLFGGGELAARPDRRSATRSRC